MYYISFDIGGTKIKYGIFDNNYKIIEKDQVDTFAHLGGFHIFEKLIEIINIYKLKYKLIGVAISSAGVVDYKNGIISYANDIIPNYTGLNLGKLIYEKTNLHATVENDVNCFALSHILDNNNDFLMMAIGTGIGGAIVINKEIYHGLTNSAGEFGQMVINNNKFEKLASVSSLIKNANELGLCVQNAVDLFELYDNKNILAHTAVNFFYKNLATGIVNLSYIFNSPKIILGGGITNRPNFLKELMIEVEKIADNFYAKSEIVISPYTNDGGMIGALVHYKNTYKK